MGPSRSQGALTPNRSATTLPHVVRTDFSSNFIVRIGITAVQRIAQSGPLTSREPRGSYVEISTLTLRSFGVVPNCDVGLEALSTCLGDNLAELRDGV